MPKQGLAKVLNGDIQRRKSHVIVPPIEIKVPPFSQYLPKVMVFHNLFQQSAILESISRNVHRCTVGLFSKIIERCRHLYSDFGVDYETYALGQLSDRCFTIAMR